MYCIGKQCAMDYDLINRSIFLFDMSTCLVKMWLKTNIYLQETLLDASNIGCTTSNIVCYLKQTIHLVELLKWFSWTPRSSPNSSLLGTMTIQWSFLFMSIFDKFLLNIWTDELRQGSSCFGFSIQLLFQASPIFRIERIRWLNI